MPDAAPGMIGPKRAHLGPSEVEEFLRGDLSATERRRVVRHLLAGCPVCQATVRLLWEPVARL